MSSHMISQSDTKVCVHLTCVNIFVCACVFLFSQVLAESSDTWLSRQVSHASDLGRDLAL